MQLEERVVGDVTVLALSGRMTMDVEYGVLKQRAPWCKQGDASWC